MQIQKVFAYILLVYYITIKLSLYKYITEQLD